MNIYLWTIALVFTANYNMEQSYRQSIDSQWHMVYAEAVLNKLYEVSKTQCYGCEIDHPSQKQHSCLMMYDDGTMMFYYFDEALDRVNELDILQKFENSLEQSSIPRTYREIYKQKFYCPDWRATQWSKDTDRNQLWDTVYRLMQLAPRFDTEVTV